MESGNPSSKGKVDITEYCKDLESKSETRRKVRNVKPSMIPVMRSDKVETKTFFCKRRPNSSLSVSKVDRQQEDFNYKLKVLREKEKAIREYYLKIEEMIQKSMIQKRECKHKTNNKKCGESSAKKMTSDPSVFKESKMKNSISDFENNIQQISKIWLKTTSDLTSTLNNLKNNSSVNPIELEMENMRIQLAIKQAKSLTLVKTRSVIAEAKKLFQNREIIRSELENLLHQSNAKNKYEISPEPLKEQKITYNQQNAEEQAVDESGDSLKDIEVDSLENIRENEKTQTADNEDLIRPRTTTLRYNNASDENITSDEISREQYKSVSSITSAKIISEMENLKKELTNKTKTITNLNKKIFDLQKTCNENSSKYNQLQVKLFEFHEKIQWNQVLWKQIGKLKERIKGMQQTIKELEYQKKQLECKILRREQEIDRLLKLNHVLNQRKQLLDAKEAECAAEVKHVETVHEKYFKNMGNRVCIDEKIIAQKQCAVNQLKKILNSMKDQENFAQKQISMFQSRIEELEKNRKA